MQMVNWVLKGLLASVWALLPPMTLRLLPEIEMELANRLPKVWQKLYRAKEAVAMPWVKLPALMLQL
jgi:hypothetical protein